MKKLVRHEIYDTNGLIEVKFIEVEEPSIEEEIKLKEEQLLKIYQEIQSLKNNITE